MYHPPPLPHPPGVPFLEKSSLQIILMSITNVPEVVWSHTKDGK